VDTGEQLRTLAKSFGLVLHLGVGPLASRGTLPERYRAAFAAAERALSEGKWLVHAERDPSSSHSPLHGLRKQLAQGFVQEPSLLSARFQRYIEAAAIRSGYRVEVFRAHLEAGWDDLVAALVDETALDARSLRELRESLERGADEASTVSELSVLYQRVIGDIELAIARPKEARQERSLRRGVAFIHERLGEPLSLSEVAKAAGFSAPHFSRLFAKSEGMTFRQYVRNLRIERARSMLDSTTLSVDRIADLCRFVSRVHFHRVFKAATGMTPSQYRSDESRKQRRRPDKA
jgi:AraC-like DNA-binding protein